MLLTSFLGFHIIERASDVHSLRDVTSYRLQLNSIDLVFVDGTQ